MLWFSVLSILATFPVVLATPIASLWNDIKVKHSWSTIPGKWECLGHPPADATIDLRVALKPHRKNALIDALYEVSDPTHAKYVSTIVSSTRLCFLTDLDIDTVRTSRKSRSPTSSHRIRKLSNSSLPGSSITMFPLLRSQSRTAEVG
jgi:tripeptidyl-peptidase-1